MNNLWWKTHGIAHVIIQIFQYTVIKEYSSKHIMAAEARQDSSSKEYDLSFGADSDKVLQTHNLEPRYINKP